MCELISRRAAIEAVINGMPDCPNGYSDTYDKRHIIAVLEDVPSVQPDDWMERNKERILRAGMEGREIEFRIGGRLFAIREKAQ